MWIFDGAGRRKRRDKYREVLVFLLYGTFLGLILRDFEGKGVDHEADASFGSSYRKTDQ